MRAPEWDDAYCDVMGRTYGESEISNIEVLGIGAALLDWVATVQRIGHASPASTLDYADGANDPFSLILRDFVAWTSGRLDMVPGDPKERLLAVVVTSDWEHELAAKVQALLGAA